MSLFPVTFGVVDFETTSREPKEAHVIEWAAVIIEAADSNEASRVLSGFVKPPVPIPPDTSAIHHIIDEDVADAQTWEEVGPGMASILASADVLVAHNQDMERQFLDPLLPGKPWVCTYKCSLRGFPDAPSHSNEGLRYYLKLGDTRGRKGTQKPHTAAHDAEITSLILHRLLEEHPLETLVQWSSEGAILPRCPIGVYRGLRWPQVPWDFLDWILHRAVDMRADVYNSAKLEWDRREAEAEDADEEVEA